MAQHKDPEITACSFNIKGLDQKLEAIKVKKLMKEDK